MIDYEDMDDLTHLSDKEKLEIIQYEINKIFDLNELLFQALKYSEDLECVHAYIYATFLIGSHSTNIKKCFLNA